MAVTVEELEIIVKAKADEALPILEKVQAKLDGIIKKSLPALQQAAGTAATVTEKAVKNVEKPVREAAEALETVSSKSVSAGKSVSKSFAAAQKSLAKTEAEIDAVNAALDRIRTEKRDNYIPEGAPNQQYVLESLLAQDKEYQKLLQRSDELVHLWDRQNAELERQKKLLEESRRKQDEIATQQAKNTVPSPKRSPSLARPVNADYISPDTYGTEYESLVNAVNKANYALEMQRQKYAALRAERTALLSMATNEASANGRPSSETLARIDDCTARLERERLALDQVSASARNAETALDSALGENDTESWSEKTHAALNTVKQGLLNIGKTSAGMAVGGVKTLFSKLFGWCKKGVSMLGKLGKSLLGFRSGMKKANGGVQSFGTRLRSIVSGALIFNGISAALRKMTEYLKSAILSTQQMRSAMGNLKGAASVAAAPIIQTLTPALSALANAAATVFSYIAKLINLLTGKSISSMKSAAKSMHSYGSAAGSAAKDVKDLQKANNTLGFDELNVIDTGKEDDASSGGGGGADEILPNFDFEGKSTLLDQVLDAIKGGDWEGAGAILAEKANSILNSFDANGWGKRFGKKLQNGISFAYGLITTFGWNSLGAKLAGLVNGTLSQVDGAQIGALLVSKFTIAIRTLGTFLATLDWAQLGQVLSNGIIGACNALVDAIHSVDWKAIGTGIKDMLCNIDWPGVFYAVGSVIGAGFGALWGVIQGALSDLWDWIKEQFFAGFDQFVTGEGNPEELGVQLITGLLNGIWSVIKGIWDWIYKNIFKPIGDGIADAFDMHSPSRVAEGWGRNIMLGMLNGLTAIWTKITVWLDNIRNGFISVWEGIKNALRPIVNGIIGFMNGMISGVVSGMNAVIDVLNHLNVHIPDWVPLFGGKSIGFSITPITAQQIPLLATGAVLKEPTLFAGGEYPGANNNPEIVAPEDRMKQAFLEAMDSANTAGFGGDIVVNVTEEIDGDVLYRNQHRIKTNRGASVGGVFAEAY